MKLFIHKQHTNILTYFPLGGLGDCSGRGVALAGWRWILVWSVPNYMLGSCV